jgi:hypothetical protein
MLLAGRGAGCYKECKGTTGQGGGVAGGGGVSIVVQHVRTLQGIRLLLPRNRDVRGQEGQCVLATV